MQKHLLAVILVSLTFGAFAQGPYEGADTAYTVIKHSTSAAHVIRDSTIKPKADPAFKPVIGLGTGMFSFYGDLYDKKFVNPQVSRIGYELSVAQRLTPALDLNFYVLFGKLGANERSISRNVNFQSEIRVGGVQLMYTFANWLPGKRIIHPYFTTGFESFEFLTKTDMKDRNGNTYYYWSDGSIRNLPETAPDASSAIFLQRDYTYESDVRELNLDGFGKYPERSFAVPIGVGALLHLSDRMDLKIGTTLHLTMTDYIDGITELSLGTRKGDAKKDHYVMTAFSLRFDLFSPKKLSATDTLGPYHFEGAEEYTLDTEDLDGDKVLDMKDKCLGTPPGLPVDENGCPLDDDKDGVPNPLDQELNTPLYAAVDEKGVQIPDSVLAMRYAFYIDSTGQFAKVEVLESTPYTSTKKNKNYTVWVGEFGTGVPSDMMGIFLGIPDIKNTTRDSLTTYTVGEYASVGEAERRKEEMIKKGIPNAKVVMKQGDRYIDPPPPVAGDPKDPKDPDIDTPPSGDEVVFRVQLGAYKRKISKSAFKQGDIFVFQTEDGLYKYSTGSFKTIEEAAARKVDLIKQFPDAFVVAYKGGKRVPLSSVGATPVKNNDKENITELDKPMSTANKDLAVFKVQIGVYRNEPPADMQEKYTKIKNIQKENTATGLTRYTVGEFKDYNQAIAFKNEIKEKYGIDDAFVVGFYDGQLLPVQDVLELMKK